MEVHWALEAKAWLGAQGCTEDTWAKSVSCDSNQSGICPGAWVQLHRHSEAHVCPRVLMDPQSCLLWESFPMANAHIQL